ncbi:MAG TPA: phage holin family protein [Prosthecobacter sp.]
MLHHLWGWGEAMLRYAKLRTELALTEAKEAGSHYGVIAGLFVGALILALLAYLFLILTIVFALAEWMDGVPHAWLKILGGATGLHVVLALVLVFAAKGRLKAGVFEKTKEEFRKDKTWRKTSTPKT